MYVLSFDPSGINEPLVSRYDSAGKDSAVLPSHLESYKHVFERYNYSHSRKWQMRQQAQGTDNSNHCSLFCLKFAHNVSELLKRKDGKKLLDEVVLSGKFDTRTLKKFGNRKDLSVFLEKNV